MSIILSFESQRKGSNDCAVRSPRLWMKKDEARPLFRVSVLCSLQHSDACGSVAEKTSGP